MSAYCTVGLSVLAVNGRVVERAATSKTVNSQVSQLVSIAATFFFACIFIKCSYIKLYFVMKTSEHRKNK